MLQLEDKNLGKPACSDIQINPKEASESVPQAWEKDGNWYYNFPGALTEAKFQKKRIPTKENWVTICEPFGKDGDKLSKELNLPKLGYRNRNNGLYYGQGAAGTYWSSSPGTTNAFGLAFGSANVRPTNAVYRANGFTVRCLKN